MRAIRASTARQVDIAAEFSISQTVVSAVKRYKGWAWLDSDAAPKPMQKRPRGEGSIRLDPNGRWHARLQVNGRRKSFYGATRDEALNKMIRARQSLLPEMAARYGVSA